MVITALAFVVVGLVVVIGFMIRLSIGQERTIEDLVQAYGRACRERDALKAFMDAEQALVAKQRERYVVTPEEHAAGQAGRIRLASQ